MTNVVAVILTLLSAPAPQYKNYTVRCNDNATDRDVLAVNNTTTCVRCCCCPVVPSHGTWCNIPHLDRLCYQFQCRATPSVVSSLLVLPGVSCPCPAPCNPSMSLVVQCRMDLNDRSVLVFWFGECSVIWCSFPGDDVSMN